MFVCVASEPDFDKNKRLFTGEVRCMWVTAELTDLELV